MKFLPAFLSPSLLGQARSRACAALVPGDHKQESSARSRCSLYHPTSSYEAPHDLAHHLQVQPGWCPVCWSPVRQHACCSLCLKQSKPQEHEEQSSPTVCMPHAAGLSRHLQRAGRAEPRRDVLCMVLVRVQPAAWCSLGMSSWSLSALLADMALMCWMHTASALTACPLKLTLVL